MTSVMMSLGTSKENVKVKCLKKQTLALRAVLRVGALLYKTQGSVATHSRCGEVLNDSVITTFFLISIVKFFLKIG